MPMPEKGTRPIEADGVRYRYRGDAWRMEGDDGGEVLIELAGRGEDRDGVDGDETRWVRSTGGDRIETGVMRALSTRSGLPTGQDWQQLELALQRVSQRTLRGSTRST